MAKRRLGLLGIGLSLAVLLAMPGCGEDNSEFSPSPASFNITLKATNVSANSAELVIRSNFGGSVPLWKNGCYYDDVGLNANKATRYVDTNLTPGTQYCYMVGGYGLFIGEVWSNTVCVTP